jgi:hypothetical protein
VVIGAPTVAALCWYLGSDLLRATTIGLSLAAVGLIWVAAPSDEDPPWQPDVSLGPPGRRDVAELSWSLRSRRGRVDEAALRRVRTLATNRLAIRHLDLADPNHRAPIERLIGTAAYTTLQPDRRHPPRLQDVVRCLDALENLDRRSR